MITIHAVYLLAGAMFAGYAALGLAHRRWGNAAFWTLLAVSFLAGDRLGDIGNGVLVLALVAVAASGALKPPAPSDNIPAPRGNGLFLVALIVPAVALLGTLILPRLPGLVEAKQATLIALATGVLIALAAAFVWLRPRPLAPLREGSRLMDSVGWVAILPQMLASLGAVFALAGVGDVVGAAVGRAIPDGSLIGAVLAYALGMALFTIVMGNAFAAFPVMAAAIGVPLLIRHYGGDPAVVAALGMLSGFCGTLATPMAANFNILPAVLLELKDRNAVVKAQIPTALPLLAVNIGLLYWLAFR